MNDDSGQNLESTGQIPVTIRPWYRQPIFGLVAMAVVIAFITTSVALYVYNISDTALLDLSRPGYEDARAEIDPVDKTSFSSSGVITAETIDEFNELYQAQLNKTKSNPFKSDALSNPSLQLGQIPE